MKVLLVEDYEDIRFVMRFMLEQEGCRVVEAADGVEAVAYAAGDGFDLILMDLNLPELDGYEATRQILSHPGSRHTPVVAVSALCAGEGRRRALEAGCVECLRKPVDAGLLAELVARYAPGGRG